MNEVSFYLQRCSMPFRSSVIDTAQRIACLPLQYACVPLSETPQQNVHCCLCDCRALTCGGTNIWTWHWKSKMMDLCVWMARTCRCGIRPLMMLWEERCNQVVWIEEPGTAGKYNVSSIDQDCVTLECGGAFRNVGAYGDHCCFSLTTSPG